MQDRDEIKIFPVFNIWIPGPAPTPRGSTQIPKDLFLPLPRAVRGRTVNWVWEGICPRRHSTWS